MKISLGIRFVMYFIAMIIMVSGIGSTLEIGGEEGRYIDAPYVEGFHMTWWSVISLVIATAIMIISIGGGEDELDREIQAQIHE